MHAWRLLWCDWLTILAIVESSQVVCQSSPAPPKMAFTLEISVVMEDFTNNEKADMNRKVVTHGDGILSPRFNTLSPGAAEHPECSRADGR
ncbi:hypothetical protein TNCV_3604791 [Trichonephila clavipes]|nr:hypothetical protein TNCV_3604791 [Trichonephila clavipes]